MIWALSILFGAFTVGMIAYSIFRLSCAVETLAYSLTTEQSTGPRLVVDNTKGN